MNTELAKHGRTIDGWSWSVAPALPAADGRIFTKILAHDGEYSVSYVYEHPTISSAGEVIYEVDSWLSDLWLSPGGTLYAGGERGRVHIRTGRDWNVVATPAASSVNSIWGPDDEQVYGVAKEGIINGGPATPWKSVAVANNLRRVRGTSRESIFAVGHRGLMLHYDRNSWQTVDLPTNLHLGGVWPIGEEVVYVVGPEGVLLVGGRDRWRVIDVGETDLFDVVEYRNQIYVGAGTSGLLQLQGDSLVPVREDINATRLSVGHGVMCVAGGWSFHRYDGERWESYVYTFVADEG